MACCFPKRHKFVKLTYTIPDKTKNVRSSQDIVDDIVLRMDNINVNRQQSNDSDSSNVLELIPINEDSFINNFKNDENDEESENFQNYTKRSGGKKRPLSSDDTDSNDSGVIDLNIMPKIQRINSQLNLDDFQWPDEVMQTQELSDFLYSCSGSPEDSYQHSESIESVGTIDYLHLCLEMEKFEEIKKFSSSDIKLLLEENIVIWKFIDKRNHLSETFLEFLRQIQRTHQLKLLSEQLYESKHNVVQASFVAGNIKAMDYFITRMGIEIPDQIVINNQNRNFLVYLSLFRLSNGYFILHKILLEMKNLYSVQKFEKMVFDALDPSFNTNLTKQLIDLFVFTTDVNLQQNILKCIKIIFEFCPNIANRQLYSNSTIYFIVSYSWSGYFILKHIINFLKLSQSEIKKLEKFVYDKYRNDDNICQHYVTLISSALDANR